MLTITRKVHHGNYLDIVSATGATVEEALDRLPVTAYDSRDTDKIAQSLQEGKFSQGWADYQITQ